MTQVAMETASCFTVTGEEKKGAAEWLRGEE